MHAAEVSQGEPRSRPAWQATAASQQILHTCASICAAIGCQAVALQVKQASYAPPFPATNPTCLQRVRQELEALKSQAPAVQAAPALVAPVTPAEPAAAPAAAAAAKEEEEEEEGGSAFAALNLVGILAAGGLYGYQTIQKKQTAEAEAAYQAKLEAGEHAVRTLAASYLVKSSSLPRRRPYQAKLEAGEWLVCSHICR